MKIYIDILSSYSIILAALLHFKSIYYFIELFNDKLEIKIAAKWIN